MCLRRSRPRPAAAVTAGGKASSPPVRTPAFPLGDSGISVPVHVSNGEPLGLLGRWQAREGCCGTALSLVSPTVSERKARHWSPRAGAAVGGAVLCQGRVGGDAPPPAPVLCPLCPGASAHSWAPWAFSVGRWGPTDRCSARVWHRESLLVWACFMLLTLIGSSLCTFDTACQRQGLQLFL